MSFLPGLGTIWPASLASRYVLSIPSSIFLSTPSPCPTSKTLPSPSGRPAVPGSSFFPPSALDAGVPSTSACVLAGPACPSPPVTGHCNLRVFSSAPNACRSDMAQPKRLGCCRLWSSVSRGVSDHCSNGPAGVAASRSPPRQPLAQRQSAIRCDSGYLVRSPRTESQTTRKGACLPPVPGSWAVHATTLDKGEMGCHRSGPEDHATTMFRPGRASTYSYI